ncbi:DUF4974 domain-containing protein [Flavobacteriaceae bacterium F08102]|nr:DUF4974 domain-containing protein [Flavobacteriaceae bacterium F08102]
MNSNLEHLIVKFLNKSATTEELNSLTRLMNDPENQKLFEDFIRVNHQLNHAIDISNEKQTLRVLMRKINQDTQRTTKVVWQRRLIYAAAASIILSFGIWFNTKSTSLNTVLPKSITNQIEVGSDKAILTLEDGKEVTLAKGNEFHADHIKSNGETLIYASGGTANKTAITYNTLTIPRGGEFFLQLSDSTKIWLNSATKLKYPVDFSMAKTRQVELVYGEAYFEVSSSDQNDGKAFKVLSRDQEIEVLGTEFNVKAYEEEQSTYTTLVHGKVAVNVDDKTMNLYPNQQAIVTANKSIKITPIEVYNEIAWKDGIFSFEGKTLAEIMTVLSRWYDMDVVFQEDSLKNKQFVGVLGREQVIEEILETIKRLGAINAYEINHKKIILK